MDRLKQMKNSLISCVQSQINGNLSEVDTEELGDAIDMIKDLEEAIYYCTITEAMEGNKKEDEMYRESEYMRDMDKPYGRMYYGKGRNPGGMKPNGGRTTMYYGGKPGRDHEDMMWEEPDYTDDLTTHNREWKRKMGQPYYDYPVEMLRDSKEGRSPLARKMYMEVKETSADKTMHMKELEKYMQELSQDITEMIEKASAEEKQMLQQKIAALATKIK